MAINLGGYPLILEDPDGEVYTWIEQNINPESYIPWLRRAFPGLGYSWLTWPTGFRQERKFRLNRFYWPAWGASRWAYGHFLCAAEQLVDIQKKAFGTSGTEQNKIQFLMDTPEPGKAAKEQLSCQVYMLPPSPLSAVPIGAKYWPTGWVNNIFIVTLVDERYYWWNKATPSVSFTDTSTWTDAFNIAKTALGISIIVDSIDSKYLNPSPQLNLSYEVIPPWLDALCFNVGHRFVAQFSGIYETQSFATAQSRRDKDKTDNPTRAVVAGGERFKDTIIIKQ